MQLSKIASSHIRAELGRQNLTRQQLAERLNEPAMWVSRRLNDQVPLTLDDLARIAAALNVSFDSLLNGQVAS